MVIPVSSSAPTAPDKPTESNNTNRISSVKGGKANPIGVSNESKVRGAYSVTLSTLARVRALRLSGSDISVIAASLGLTRADVDSTLGVTVSSGDQKVVALDRPQGSD
jgi:hypothetical protein